MAASFFVVQAPAQETNQTSIIVPESSQPALQEIAAKLAKRAEKTGCHSASCVLLVANFTTTSGMTSRLGLQLADEFAVLLAKALPKARVLERASLEDFLMRERIASSLLKEPEELVWLGNSLGATTVLSGDINAVKIPLQGLFTLLDVHSKRNVESFGTELPAVLIKPKDLNGAEPFLPLNQPKTTRAGTNVFGPGIQGVGSPSCFYMPNPPYSQLAREAKFSGVVRVEAVITVEGTVTDARIQLGAPFGLNEMALSTMKTWKCKSALKDGQPVPTYNTFEVNFRIN